MSAAATASMARLTLNERHARMRCFVESAPDATIYFQVVDLGQQVYVWIAVGGAKLQNMYLAIQSRQVRAAAATSELAQAITASMHSVQHLAEARHAFDRLWHVR